MIYDTIIIGGGVVGLSILRSALLSGYSAILLERNPHLCDGASGRNSGVICTGVDASPGSLERALIRDSISQVREFCTLHNVPLRECGSLVCLWPWDDDDISEEDNEEKKVEDGLVSTYNDITKHEKLRNVLRDSHIAGDKDASFLDAESVSMLEPSLSKLCRGAVYIPGEIVVDPWLFPLALATHSRELAGISGINYEAGDVIRTGREVSMELSSFDEQNGVWTLVARVTSDGNVEDEHIVVTARSIINAAGIDSDIMQHQASNVIGKLDNKNIDLKPPNFEARPRRGQYLIYSAPKGVHGVGTEDSKPDHFNVPQKIPARPIQPVPTERTKGIFVYSTLYDQIVVGPTAEDQLSRTDNSLDPDVAKELSAHSSRIFGRIMGSSKNMGDPDFDVIGEYVGIRPGTSRRDYQIQMNYPAKFITVGGIRSTGLTASLGIGRHVVQSLLSTLIQKSDGKPIHIMCPTPLPDVRKLVQDYHDRGDGMISIRGHDYKVTHPLTKMGWDARTGIAV